MVRQAGHQKRIPSFGWRVLNVFVETDSKSHVPTLAQRCVLFLGKLKGNLYHKNYKAKQKKTP